MSDGDQGGRREWGERIRRERERRGWSQNDAVQALREVALGEHDVELPEPDSLVRTVYAVAPDAPVVQDFTERVRALRTS